MTDERIVKLETYRETDNIAINTLSSKMDETHKIVQEIQQQLSKQKGFFAGAMFVILPAWSVVTIMATSLWDKITGQGA